MSASSAPHPTSRSADILLRQDTDEALVLLMAQRKIYSRGKRWSTARVTGVLLIAILGPITSALFPETALGLGALAGLWIFLGRLVFRPRELDRAAAAAAIQEKFDSEVFGLTLPIVRTGVPTTEEIHRYAAPLATLRQRAADEDLIGWYPIDPELPGHVSIAIAQRANPAYSERLLRINASLWLAGLLSWVVLALAISVWRLSATQLLLGVVLPLLPALLDIVEEWQAVRRAARVRRVMAHEIERRILNFQAEPLTESDFETWQYQLYNFRSTSPLVPDIVYKRLRRKNEEAMNATAADLARRVKVMVRDQGGATGGND